jgi:hypothetical protein
MRVIEIYLASSLTSSRARLEAMCRLSLVCLVTSRMVKNIILSHSAFARHRNKRMNGADWEEEI